ncbi:MAG: methyl-accepting chemotaxis protein [Planctomycetota bacterium]
MLKRWLQRVRGLWPWTSNNAPADDRPSEAALLEALRAEHERTRTEAHREVGAVLGETEQATLSVSSSLDQVVHAAQAFIGDIKGRLGDLEAGGEDGVSAKLERQCTLVTDFLAELRECVHVQRCAAERMLATSHKVAAAADSVSKISTASRVLCLNTMIEAGRLGDAGQPMIVIADQMRTLSEQIGKSNEEISSSINALLPTLEEVGASSTRVDERAASFSGEFEVQAAEVGDIAERLRETAHAALDGGDDKLDTILGNSRRAIENLQTQDLVSQRLRRVLQLLDRSGVHLEEAPQTPSVDDVPAPPMGPSQDEAKPDVYLSEKMGGEDERELDAGEMMMF